MNTIKTDATLHSDKYSTERVRQSIIPAPFRNRKWLLPILCGTVCAIVAAVVLRGIPNTYRSDTTLFFPSTGNTTTGSLLSAITSGGQGAQTDSSGSVGLLGGMVTSPQLGSGPNTSIAVLSSDRCQREVATELNLPEYYHSSLSDAIIRLTGSVSFAMNKYGLLQIEAMDKDPVMAAKIVAAETRSLKSIAGELTSAASRRNREFVFDRLAITRAQLQRQEALLSKLEIKGTLNMTEEASSAKLVTVYADLITQANQAAVNLASVRAKLKVKNQGVTVAADQSTNLPDTVAFAAEPRRRLRTLEASYALAAQTLGTDNPKFRLLQIEVAQARKDVRKEVAREVYANNTGIATDVADLYAEEAGLTAEKDGLDQSIKKIQHSLLLAPVSIAQEDRLMSDAKTTQLLVSMLQTEGERARIAEARDASTFVVFDTPKPADGPFFPRRGYTVMLALLTGMFIGIAWLVSDSVINQRRKTASESASASTQ